MRHIGLGIIVVGLCGTQVACRGNDDESRSKQQGEAPADAAKALAPYLIGPDDLMRTKPRTPERSLLVFWQAVQFQNAPRAYGLLSKRVIDGVSPAAFAREVTVVSPRFNSRPQIIQRHTSGNTADVAAALLFYGEDAKVVAVTPRTFAFIHEGGRWRLADLKYFRQRAAEGRKAERG